jgi:hypothetical protein
MIIGGAVAAIALIGGVFALVNSGKDGPKTDPNPINNIGPVINTDGPAPAPPATVATVPGPTPPSVVTTTIAPPPTSPPPTSPPPTTPGTASTGNQPVLDKIAVAIPSGWKVIKAESGYVFLAADSGDAQYRVAAGPTKGTAQSLADSWIADSAKFLTSVKADQSKAADTPSSNVVSAWFAHYNGVLATNSGSLPVEGYVYTFVTQSGVGVITEAFIAQGGLDKHVKALQAMLDSVIATL